LRICGWHVKWRQRFDPTVTITSKDIPLTLQMNLLLLTNLRDTSKGLPLALSPLLLRSHMFKNDLAFNQAARGFVRNCSPSWRGSNPSQSCLLSTRRPCFCPFARSPGEIFSDGATKPRAKVGSVHRIGELAVSMQHVLIPGLSSSRPRAKPSERENMMPAARTSLVLGKKQRNMPCRRIDSLPCYSAFLLLRTRLGTYDALCSHILLTNCYEHPGSRKAHAAILQESFCMASILRSN
jgi:hypothetical protein